MTDIPEFPEDEEDDRDFNEDWEDRDKGKNHVSAFLREMLDGLGIESVEDIIIDFSDVPPSQLRGGRFGSLEAAIWKLYDMGVLSFSKIVYYVGEDKYGHAIPDTTP